jgi:hypothetical protein
MQDKRRNTDDFLRPRFIINTGAEKVLIKNDPEFDDYVIRSGRRLIKPVWVRPLELVVLHNFYMIPYTESGRPAELIVSYSLEDARALQAQIKNKTAEKIRIS